MCVVICLKNKESEKEDCLGENSQAGNIVSPRRERTCWVGGDSVVLCYVPPQPKLSHLKQPPLYPAHVSVGWLDGRGLLHVVMSEPQTLEGKPSDGNFSAFICLVFGEVPLAKAIHR